MFRVFQGFKKQTKNLELSYDTGILFQTERNEENTLKHDFSDKHKVSTDPVGRL